MYIIKSIQAFIYYSTMYYFCYWTDIFFCTYRYKSSKLRSPTNNFKFISSSNAEITLWFVRIYILPSFHLIMIQMPELDMPHYEPNNNTGIEKWTTLWHWNIFVLWTTYFEEEEYECWTLLIIFIAIFKSQIVIKDLLIYLEIVYSHVWLLMTIWNYRGNTF